MLEAAGDDIGAGLLRASRAGSSTGASCQAGLTYAHYRARVRPLREAGAERCSADASGSIMFSVDVGAVHRSRESRSPSTRSSVQDGCRARRRSPRRAAGVARPARLRRRRDPIGAGRGPYDARGGDRAARADRRRRLHGTSRRRTSCGALVPFLESDAEAVERGAARGGRDRAAPLAGVRARTTSAEWALSTVSSASRTGGARCDVERGAAAARPGGRRRRDRARRRRGIALGRCSATRAQARALARVAPERLRRESTIAP